MAKIGIFCIFAAEKSVTNHKNFDYDTGKKSLFAATH